MHVYAKAYRTKVVFVCGVCVCVGGGGVDIEDDRQTLFVLHVNLSKKHKLTKKKPFKILSMVI